MSPLLKKSAFLPSRLKRSPIILLIRALKIDGAIPMRTESIIFLSKEMDTFGMRAFLEVYSSLIGGSSFSCQIRLDVWFLYSNSDGYLWSICRPSKNYRIYNSSFVDEQIRKVEFI